MAIDVNKQYTLSGAQLISLGQKVVEASLSPDVSNFITKTVDDLTNYYTKSNTYTKSEVQSLISLIPQFSIQVVQALPTQDISTTTVYLLADPSGTSGHLYTEYIYVNNAWETLGSQDVDLTDYVTKTELSTTLGDYLTSTTAASTYVAKETGKGLSTNDYTTAEKNKLSNIQAGAEANVQSDWTQSNSMNDDFIKNKPEALKSVLGSGTVASPWAITSDTARGDGDQAANYIRATSETRGTISAAYAGVYEHDIDTIVQSEGRLALYADLPSVVSNNDFENLFVIASS